MSLLGFKNQSEATLKILTEDVTKSSEIEGEILNKDQVRSSIAKRMGVDIGTTPTATNRYVEGIVEVLLDATKNYSSSLNINRLFNWHAALFPTGRSGLKQIIVANWRNEQAGTMQVISEAYGMEKIHFEAPSHEKIPDEMKKFLNWFNDNSKQDLVLKAAIAHLWFLTIHPFEDGNGRIGRALIDMLLAKSEGSSQRFYSMSSQIQKDRKHYYLQLERTQKGTLDITNWIEWFLQCLKKAIDESENLLRSILEKARFWKLHEAFVFNERQKKILNLLLDGFQGNLTSSKWANICKCSQDTANRDIKDLLNTNVLAKSDSSGRSTHYILLKSNNQNAH